MSRSEPAFYIPMFLWVCTIVCVPYVRLCIYLVYVHNKYIT